jgi:hypothetical protein
MCSYWDASWPVGQKIIGDGSADGDPCGGDESTLYTGTNERLHGGMGPLDLVEDRLGLRLCDSGMLATSPENGDGQ